MSATKIMIASSNANERAYCIAVAKAVDDELVDGDFIQYNSSDLNSIIAAGLAYTGTNKPIIAYPYIYNGSYISKTFRQYPLIQLVSSWVYEIASTNLPYQVPSPDFSKISPMVQVCGGLAGVSDWLKGTQLEFVEEAHIMYLNGSTPVLTFPISNIVRNVNKARLTFSVATPAVSFGYSIHIYNAGSGFQNNPNGRRNIDAIGSGYLDINFDVGTGTYNGSGTYAVLHYTSGSIAAVAAKLGRIMRKRSEALGREVTFWEARYCARMTSSNPTRDDVHGYGEIDVAAAIAYNGSIIDDPYDTLGDIETLSVAISRPRANFSMDEVANAKQILLYENDLLVNTTEVDFEESYEYEYNPFKLGDRTYKVKASRLTIESDYSNEVGSNITSLQNLPATAKYNYDDFVFTKLDGIIQKLRVLSITIDVTNPYGDVSGLQRNLYKFQGKGELEIEESKLFADIGSLLSYDKELFAQYVVDTSPSLNADGTSYFILDGDAFFHNPLGENLGGLYLGEIDFEAIGYDFTNNIVDACNFKNATMPLVQNTIAALILAVKSYDKQTTKWTDNLPIGDHITTKIKTFLEGAYSGSAMTFQLNTDNLIPLTQPYSGTQYDYDGEENVAAIPANVVDWVYVELRLTANGSPVAQRAGFIKSNGMIVDLDGTSDLIFPRMEDGDYYVVIGHRNHIPIMSAAAIPLFASSLIYDFSTAANKAYGSDQKSLGGGVYGLYGGDANKTCVISSADASAITAALTQNGYLITDTNLSGVVSSPDVTIATDNNSKATNVPNLPY